MEQKLTATETPTTTSGERNDDFVDEKPVPVRHPGQWIGTIVLAIVAIFGVKIVFFDRVKRGNTMETRFGWGKVGEYLFDPNIMRALVVTIELTIGAMALAIVGGVLLAVMRLSKFKIFSSTSWLYIWFFRGTPVLVQLLFWYNLSYLFPTISIGLPFGPSFGDMNANEVITPFLAAFLGLGLHEAAYMCEIVRAGILSVDEGQVEAAESLGMPHRKTMWRIVLPQAMRVIIPPTGSQVINMLKMTSIASVITVVELLRSVQLIYSVNYETIPLLIVASLWYLAVVSVLTCGQYYVERYYSRGVNRVRPPTPLQRFRAAMTTFRPRHSQPMS